MSAPLDPFFDLSSELMATLDERGAVQQANPALLAALGLSAGDLRGTLLVSLVHPGEQGAVEAALGHALGGGRASFEARLRGEGGGWFLASFAARRPEGAALSYLVGRDLRAERARRHDVSRYLGLLDGTSDYVAVSDMAGQITDINHPRRERRGFLDPTHGR